jgi:cobalt-zinc-cadmium efflux system outer membrane protein
MRFGHVLLCAAFLMSAELVTVHAQPVFRPLTVAQAVDEAVRHNLTLLAARTDLSIADAAIVTARLRPNPVLSGSADSLDLLGTGFDEINQAGPPQYAVRIDVPIERGRKREIRTELAARAKEVTVAQLADTVRRVKLDVTMACVDVLEAKAKLRLAQDNLQALERLVDLNTRRLTGGAIPALEVTRSRVAMLQYRSNVRTAELALSQARLKLLPFLGRKPDEAPVDIEDQLGLMPLTMSLDLPELQRTAQGQRPDVEALRQDQARSQADLRLQVAQGKIDYTVGAEYRRAQGINGTGNMLGFFVSAPLPIFNRNQGEIERAVASQGKATQSLAALETTLAGEVAAAYSEFESARQLLTEIERDLLQPSSDARAGVTYVYQAGASTLLDVLDAQRAFNDTMDTYYSAQASYRRAVARLALVTGKDFVP